MQAAPPTHVLCALQIWCVQADDEVHSYLTMYLGASKAVDSFAKEFTLRKRAARGTGESREWQTCAAPATPPPAIPHADHTPYHGPWDDPIPRRLAHPMGL